MTMLTHGADVAALRDLGTKLAAQAEAITAILGVGTAVESTSWVGPAREAFLGQWNTSFKTSLTNLQLAFETAATECSTRADGLEAVMGGGGVAGGSGSAGSRAV
jgi:hypothetical protein